MLNPHIETGIERLRIKWPQSHFQRGQHGDHLIIVPGVVLPKGYNKTICTVLFIAPPGYPAARPDHFFTDIDIRLENLAIPYATVTAHPELKRGNFPPYREDWAAWRQSMWWSWHLQAWDPNRSNLYTYMKVIQQRLGPAR